MLYEQIKNQIVTTMKGQAEDRMLRLTLLRGLKAAIDLQVKEDYAAAAGKNASTAMVAAVGDGIVEKVLVRELKKRVEAEEAFRKAGALDAAAAEVAESAIIKQFLPQPMSVEEVQAKLVQVVETLGKNIGPVMKEMREFCGARFPGKDLSEMVKAALI